MQRFFITGTDTNCGKTYVTCRLLDYLTKTSKQAYAIKPIATGCEKRGDYLWNEDKEKLAQGNGSQNFANVGWEFIPPISPHLAAEFAGIPLSANEIINCCLQPCFQKLDYLLIEGAGGVCVPLNARETWLDVMESLQASVIFVVGMRLGCLNHALLTEMVLKQRRISIAGWIANCIDSEMLYLEENILTLKQRLTSPHLATLRHKGAFEQSLKIFAE